MFNAIKMELSHCLVGAFVELALVLTLWVYFCVVV